jgi:ADP-ribose pyrophosphatase YjhB (NUDIX family)
MSPTPTPTSTSPKELTLANVPVAGVVIRDNQARYLLVQEKQPKAYGLWNLPAGWVDEGETLRQAAIREAKEEVGLDIKLIDQDPLLSCLNDAADRMLNSFRAEVTGGELKIQEDELLDAKWFSLAEVLELSAGGKIRAQWVVDSIKKADAL